MAGPKACLEAGRGLTRVRRMATQIGVRFEPEDLQRIDRWGWVVSEHQGKLMARMVTGSPSVYVLEAETHNEAAARRLGQQARHHCRPSPRLSQWTWACLGRLQPTFMAYSKDPGAGTAERAGCNEAS
jgi:hypothetical protein